jgi:mRNA-degrading endonuclease YafQ of YafQ-DinJ toxin-antitoxin module
MWEIYEHRRVVKQLGILPIEILKIYEKWKDVARMSGPTGLRVIKGFHDEALRGEWKEHRSSRLGVKHRIIYKINKKEIFVQVVNITPHDYRRK